MIPRIQRSFERLEAERHRALATVGSHSEAQQAFHPEADQWSMLQVIEHLVLAEEATLKTLERGPPPEAAITLRSRAVLQLIYVIFRLGIRVKVPMGSLAPASALLPSLTSRWQNARTALALYLDRLTSDQLGQPRFRHPVAGWLTIGQGLDFLARHIQHHERQLRRIGRAPGFPGSRTA